MAWRLRYQVNFDYVPRGGGQQQGINATPLPGSGVSMQTLEFVQSPNSGPIVAGGGTARVGGNELNAADITTLTNAVAADLATQLTAQLTRVNQWVQGGALSIV